MTESDRRSQDRDGTIDIVPSVNDVAIPGELRGGLARKRGMGRVGAETEVAPDQENIGKDPSYQEGKYF